MKVKRYACYHRQEAKYRGDSSKNNRAQPGSACGYHSLSALTVDDLTTFDREMAHLTGIPYGGVSI